MQFNSLHFLIFFPLVTIVNLLFPKDCVGYGFYHQLLFLYELESQICLTHCIIYADYLFKWYWPGIYKFKIQG